MRNINKRAPKPSSFALAAVLIASVCLQPLMMNAIAAQKSASELSAKNRAGNSRPADEDALTRPRRVEDRRLTVEPIIRIALAMDATAVTLGSPSGLRVRASSKTNDGEKFTSSQIRVELRSATIAARPKARASDLIDTRDTNGKIAKRQSERGNDSDRSSFKPAPQRAMQVVAIEGERVIALSDERLVVSAANEEDTRKNIEADTRRKESDREPARENEARDNYSPRRVAESQHPRIPAASRFEQIVRVNGKDFRGEIHLVINPRGRINVVNAVPLEDYLRGVVPMELPPSAFPAIEALKAQAVAARTYAIERRGQFNSEGFDLYTDARSQVYGGVAAERDLTNRAVEETRGMIAVYYDENGNAAPIQALYTSTCGGRTENNEDAFGGKPIPYLRSVACAADRVTLAGHDIVTTRAAEPLTNSEGRLITREVTLFEAFGFPLPRRVSVSYLRDAADYDELKRWIEQAARIARNDKPQIPHSDISRLAAFAEAISDAIYGEGRANVELSPADVDYLLVGLGALQIPREARADVAMLLKSGALRLPSDGVLRANAQVTRGLAIEIIARALYFKSQSASAPSTANLKTQTAQAAEGGRLILAGAGLMAKAQSREPRFTTTSAINSTGNAARSNRDAKERAQREPIAQEIAARRDNTGESRDEVIGYEIENGARLFRSIGGESYAVDRLTLIGGERVTYHLNAAGRVDFLEATATGRSASSDQLSRMSEWQERISIDELSRRLARARVSVGQVEDLSPVAFSTSSRVTELEVTGSEGRARLHSYQIRNALGLKENLFVIDRERDERGRVTAFVFTGRGWGHGVGMCQTGAYGLAKEGYSFTAILQKYYTGVKVQKMY